MSSLVLAASDLPASPVVAAMAFGVVMAIVGHSAKNNAVAAIGIAILFLATAAMMVAGITAFNDDPADPRPCNPELKGLDCK
ncbi:MAG TPA: hypothetical protein VFZ89_11315 [Solirubrobacteraceae bacterium]